MTLVERKSFRGRTVEASSNTTRSPRTVRTLITVRDYGRVHRADWFSSFPPSVTHRYRTIKTKWKRLNFSFALPAGAVSIVSNWREKGTGDAKDEKLAGLCPCWSRVSDLGISAGGSFAGHKAVCQT